MGAQSKRAKTVRREQEFDLERLVTKLFMPRDGRNIIPGWTLKDIYVAREEQQLGQFVLASRLAEQFRTDDALFTAWHNRLAPRRCIPVEIEAVKSARGALIGGEANALYGPDGVGLNEDTLADIHGCLVDHGIAFGCNVATPRADGSRVDLEMHYWPIEYIRWDPVFRVFKARADPTTVQPGDIPESDYNQYGFVGGYWIPVIHGDGRWVIFKKNDLEPFRKDAALLPAALVWARHAFAAKDWAKGSKAHGSAKVIGELPSGVPLQGADGNLSLEAQAFVDLLRSIASDEAPAGIRPAGSKTDFLTNSSTAWQVWSELMNNSEKAAARIYLGTDGTLGSQGGAPGVNIQALFGVADTKVRGDLNCISRGIDTGLIEPWCAMNFGDSKLAPKRKYLFPNDEKERETSDYAKRNEAFTKALVALRQAGITPTPDYVIGLAAEYRVRAPTFAAPIAPPTSPGAGATQENSIVMNTIKHEGDKWCVYSEGGKKLGEYKTKAEAEKRLRQIEYYKNQ
jgi:hypothetical protein